VVNLDRGGEREIKLEGLTDLKGLVSAPGGNGSFVSLNGTVGNRLLYVWPDGRSRPLGDISGWAVPSPDGRHVAFLNRIISSNAWVIERR
jgi:eukaryotic-like serine/threonine-protein kinase